MDIYVSKRLIRILFTLLFCIANFTTKVQSRRNPNQQKDRETNRKYSRWNSWSPCPTTCRIGCYTYCVQIRYKTCLRTEFCQNNVLRDERACGRCETQQQVLDSSESDSKFAATTDAVAFPDANYPSIRAQETGELVRLAMHCLPNYHFSNWGNWSECFDVCRKVRFRHCTTALCIERVPHMEDSAVKQEEWCIPERDSKPEIAPNCEQYLNYISMIGHRNSPPLQLGQCEAIRRRLLTQRLDRQEKVRRVKKPVPKGSVLNLGVSCGVRNTQERRLRIIGGTAAKKGRWPWQVAIMIDKKMTEFNDFPHIFGEQPYFNYTESPTYVQYCGGTLINNDWVLTAAHCVKQRETGLRKPNMVVMVGETDMRVMKETDDSWQNNIYKISKVIGHSRFEWESVNNDIALLKLEKSVPNTPSLGFSCVPDDDLDVGPGTECTAVGWGKHKKYPKQRASKRLQEVVLPLVSRQQCKDAFNFTITKNQMCAGYEDGRSDSCDGDSGGPLLCTAKTKEGERWVIYGITSFGSNDGCGIAGKYGVYTKVNNYSKWIKYAMETGEQLHESKSETEQRRKRHKKQNRKRDRNKDRSLGKTNNETTLSVPTDEKVVLSDDAELYFRRRRRESTGSVRTSSVGRTVKGS